MSPKERKLGEPDVYPEGSVSVMTAEEAAEAISEARADEDDDEAIERDLAQLDELVDNRPRIGKRKR